VLVLLDNVGDVNDIRPMLPAGAGSLVLVTSRDQLAGLVARDGARRISLDVLAPGEAHTLLGRLVGADRVLAELEATAELASLCAGLPLALRIAAANLTAQQQHSLAGYAAELRAGNRLAALVVEGDEQTAVRAAFELSYTALPEPARRLFRLLGLVPGPDVSAEVAAALAGISRDEAARLLDRLVGAHLIDQPRPGRYAFHDLLRLYAQSLPGPSPAAPSTSDDRAAAAHRLYTYYLFRSHEAARPLFGHMFRIPLPPDGTAPAVETFADTAAAIAWYDAERAGILAAVASAEAHGLRRFAWLLADGIRGYLLLRMYTVDWLAVARVGLAAAEAEDDQVGQFAMLLSLGVLSSRQSRHEQAIDYHTRARQTARAAGLPVGESVALSNLGGVLVELGRLSEAADLLRAALAVGVDGNYRGAQVNNLGNLGSVSLYLGRLDQAVTEFREAVRLADELNSQTVYAVDLTNLGEAYGLVGRYDDAEAALTEALAAHRATGNRTSEAAALRGLATVERERGRLGHALALSEQAVSHAAGSGHRRGESQARSVLAAVHLALGEPASALDHYGRALRLARDTGHRYPEVDAVIGLARAQRYLGRPGEALGHVAQALSAARAAEFRLLEGRALTELAELRRDLGDIGAARTAATQGLAQHRRCGYPVGTAATLVLLGRLWPGHPVHWREALDIYRGIGHPAATQVSRLIERSEPVPPGGVVGPFVGHNGQHQEGSIP
jgi:tetratricopeptide (TPR) repeat protein